MAWRRSHVKSSRAGLAHFTWEASQSLRRSLLVDLRTCSACVTVTLVGFCSSTFEQSWRHSVSTYVFPQTVLVEWSTSASWTSLNFGRAWRREGDGKSLLMAIIMLRFCPRVVFYSKQYQ